MTASDAPHVAEPAAILHPGRDEGCLDPKIVGGKAAALTALLREGLPVPPFFVALAPDGFEQGLSLADCRAIDEALAEIQPGPFAVRSSARDEDGAEHSHAGQFLSLLDVEDSGVPDAALKVWESGAQENVAAYRASRGLEAGDATPAVIVQRMARARVAGVAFAADPVSGRRDRIVISAIAGLGDALVGGEEDGETTVVDRDSGTVVEGPAGGVLSNADVAAIVEAVKRVSGLRGAPQDIEWRSKARPSICFSPAPSPRLCGSLRSAILWSRSSTTPTSSKAILGWSRRSPTVSRNTPTPASIDASWSFWAFRTETSARAPRCSTTCWGASTGGSITTSSTGTGRSRCCRASA
ncbi:PEP/pyruvate-binding domain-containing protein [Chenggangzhangella methanolivorans]|uniref:Pyruvate phosphate dikinase AMP/ATP-binding domain-containing protein n=1 Tax=Chenggangzhangella methanolivorans TaxID=1437009 RepID=A0A9E6RAF6_9HYPH|nr:PEP/pyruvate-binding domain-containing protein [Chenggangzhangella methanolivorans]QZO01163.1 hypothetical protein K6K41_06345 [Chenggangzhangella methanolivorans]